MTELRRGFVLHLTVLFCCMALFYKYVARPLDVRCLSSAFAYVFQNGPLKT